MEKSWYFGNWEHYSNLGKRYFQHISFAESPCTVTLRLYGFLRHGRRGVLKSHESFVATLWISYQKKACQNWGRPTPRISRPVLCDIAHNFYADTFQCLEKNSLVQKSPESESMRDKMPTSDAKDFQSQSSCSVNSDAFDCLEHGASVYKSSKYESIADAMASETFSVVKDSYSKDLYTDPFDDFGTRLSVDDIQQAGARSYETDCPAQHQITRVLNCESTGLNRNQMAGGLNYKSPDLNQSRAQTSPSPDCPSHNTQSAVRNKTGVTGTHYTQHMPYGEGREGQDIQQQCPYRARTQATVQGQNTVSPFY